MALIQSADDLATHPTKTNIDEISLILLQEYYEKNLLPYIFEYTLDDGTVISLKFKKDHFCHLAGVNHPAQIVYKNNEKMLYQFFNSRGYKKISKSEITLKSLRNLHKSEFDSTTKKKCTHFHFLHRILDNPQIVKAINPIGHIVVDFYFYNEFDHSWVHLGIEKEEGNTYFMPKTFVIKYTNSQTAKRFIMGQTPVALTNQQKIDNLTGKPIIVA